MSNQNTALIPTNEPVGQLQDIALNQFIDTEPVQTGLQWSHSIELLLADWCDQAKCFEWMHTQAYSLFNRRSRLLTISSNIVAAVGGLSNVIAGGVDINGFQLSWAFGSLAILVSILNMIQEKMGYAALATKFEIFSTSWGVIRRKIEEQLALPPSARRDCGTFMKYIRQDINQVSIDGNSKIPSSIRDACSKKFTNIPNFDIPDICGDMEHTRIYVPLE